MRPSASFLLLSIASGSTSAFRLLPKHSNRGFSNTAMFGKKILICFDGTGNNARDFEPDSEKDRNISNVLKLHVLAGGSIDADNEAYQVFENDGQISLYSRGVGAKSKLKTVKTLNTIKGDLSQQTVPMKKRLQKVYEKGDKLYLFGFSRGSSSARLFATHLEEEGLKGKDGETVEGSDVEVAFMGCFDTVSMQLKSYSKDIVNDRRKKKLPSCTYIGETSGKIASIVKQAVHNVVLDDNRMWAHFPRYPPILMGSEDRVNEVWFSGEHGDSGGTYYHRGLPDTSFEYMQEWCKNLGDDSLQFLEAKDIKKEAFKLEGYPDYKITNDDIAIQADATDKSHLVDKQITKPSYRPVYVAENDDVLEGGTVKIHKSVFEHMKTKKHLGEYFPVNPNLKEVDFILVGSLGEELHEETVEFDLFLEKELISEQKVTN